MIIPEDHTNDQYMLKPIISALMSKIGKSKANIQVCSNPRLQGIRDALSLKILKKIIEQYGTFHLFLLLIDRDGDSNRKTKLNVREKRTKEMLREDQVFFAENAWQEIEVWVLAGHDLPLDWNWKEIRKERDPKEVYYIPYAENRNLLGEVAQGRKKLAEIASKNYSSIRHKCPEIAELENRINTRLS